MNRIMTYLASLKSPVEVLKLLMVVGGLAVVWALLSATQGPPKPWEDSAPRYAVGEMAGFEASFPAQPIPNLRLEGPDGGVRLSTFTDGRVLVVNLWATWCAPCVEELPSLAALQESFGDEIRVLAVAQEGGDGSRQAQMIERVGADALTVLLDPQLSLGRSYTDNLQLPMTVVYGPRGREVGRLNGPADWSSEEAKRLIRAAMAGPVRR